LHADHSGAKILLHVRGFTPHGTGIGRIAVELAMPAKNKSPNGEICRPQLCRIFPKLGQQRNM